MKKIIVAGAAFALSSAVMIHAQQQTEVNLNGQPVNVTVQPGGGFVIAQRTASAANRGQDRQGAALLGGGRLGEHSDARRRQSDRPENDRPRLSRQRRAHATRGRPALGRTDCFHHGFGSRHRLHARSREPHGAGNAGQGASSSHSLSTQRGSHGPGRSGALRPPRRQRHRRRHRLRRLHRLEPPVVGAAADVVARSNRQKACRIG